MAAVVIIPPIEITQGKPFSQSYRIEDPTAPDDERIISLAGVTAEVTLSDRAFITPFYRAAAEIAEDRINVQISATDTAGFDALPFIQGKASAVMQINITAAEPALNQLWQGQAIIAGQFK